MKKVLYTVTKVGKETTKVSGLGHITDKDLITAQISKNGNAYIRVYEDCVTDCHKIAGKDNEYKGAIWEVIEIDDRAIDINYYIYFKIID